MPVDYFQVNRFRTLPYRQQSIHVRLTVSASAHIGTSEASASSAMNAVNAFPCFASSLEIAPCLTLECNGMRHLKYLLFFLFSLAFLPAAYAQNNPSSVVVNGTTWNKCADEHGTCSFSGTQNVLYGAWP